MFSYTRYANGRTSCTFSTLYIRIHEITYGLLGIFFRRYYYLIRIIEECDRLFSYEKREKCQEQ